MLGRDSAVGAATAEQQQPPDAPPAVTLSVFWCGTSGVLAPATTQVGLFFLLAEGVDVSDPLDDPEARLGSAADHFKMGFDGCGNTHGCSGAIFASGLAGQARAVRRRVEILLAAGRSPVRLNVLGLSRGGIGAMKLTQMLVAIDPAQLQLNLCLFDAVPGNLLCSATLDHLLGGCLTTARQSIDLGSSRNLRRCLAIYPHEPLPALAFHAPVFPRYPSCCQVTELVTLSCHQGAFFSPNLEVFGDFGHRRRGVSSMDLAGVLSFLCVSDFLRSCGTRLAEHADLQLTQSARRNLLTAMDTEAARRDASSRRLGHGHGCSVRVVRRQVGSDEAAPTLNAQHWRMKKGLESTGGEGVGNPSAAEQRAFVLQKERGRSLLGALCCCLG